MLSDLVEDFAGARDARGVPEVVTSGHNERTAAPDEDEARSAVEQRTAMTPSSSATPAGGSSCALEALEWWVVGGVSVVSIVVAAVIGGEMWAPPAIVLPLTAGWVALQYWTVRGRDASARPTGDSHSARRRLLPLSTFIVAGVIWFTLVVGWIGDLL